MKDDTYKNLAIAVYAFAFIIGATFMVYSIIAPQDTTYQWKSFVSGKKLVCSFVNSKKDQFDGLIYYNEYIYENIIVDSNTSVLYVNGYIEFNGRATQISNCSVLEKRL